MLSILLALLVAATGIPRTADAELTALAEQRASEIAVTFTHRPLPELDNGTWDAWAEILAYRGGDDTPLPEIVYGVDGVGGWMNSPEHAGILLNPRYTHIGCGFEWVGVRLYVACVLADRAGSVAADPPPTVTPPPAVDVPQPPTTMSNTATAPTDTAIQETR